jgi:hypothetical protein
MTDSRNDDARAPYEAPVVRDLGPVTEVTRGGATAVPDVSAVGSL